MGPRALILAAARVKELQYFLIDAAKRYVATGSAGLSGAGELLSSAAALDYVLMVSSERPAELVDDANPVAVGCRETMQRAAVAALDFIDGMIAAPSEVFEEFMARHVRAGRILETFRSLREAGVLGRGDIAFRIVTSASDLLERRRR